MPEMNLNAQLSANYFLLNVLKPGQGFSAKMRKQKTYTDTGMTQPLACRILGSYCTKEVNTSLLKSTLNLNSRLDKLGLISLFIDHWRSAAQCAYYQLLSI